VYKTGYIENSGIKIYEASLITYLMSNTLTILKGV
jgi:hypothetical protein